jgi:DDE superfamily endonuclease
LAGWGGSAHDERVLEDALDKGFQVPEGKYYLGHAGYSNTKRTLVPHRGVRYHLKEQARRGLRPANKQELFNLRHSTLRNAIERAFGVWKHRFKILRAAPEYDIKTQIGLVYATSALHNFIEKAGDDDDELAQGNEGQTISQIIWMTFNKSRTDRRIQK